LIEEKLIVDGKDKLIAADFAECPVMGFSSGPFGLMFACGRTHRHRSIDVEARKRLTWGHRAYSERKLRWGSEYLDSGRIRARARRTTSKLSANSAGAGLP
jgi:hypothetical protein